MALLKKRHSECQSPLKQNQIRRFSETTKLIWKSMEVSMEETRRPVRHRTQEIYEDKD